MRQEEKEIILYCDGRCEGASEAAVGRYAYVVYHGTQKVLEGTGEAGRGREMTANVAEYVAVLRGLSALRAAGYAGGSVRVRSNSRLVMQQLGMLCVVWSKRLLKWWRAVRSVAREFDAHFEWVPRAWNREADEQIRQALSGRPQGLGYRRIMKRYKHLFEEVCSLENLHLAYLKARRGKQHRQAVEAFTFHLEGELLRLQDELKSDVYVPGPYRQFTVYESKKRLISAAPFRDRVVHHAICNVIEPLFEPTFISDSYACRLGKGQHAALKRLQTFLPKNRYVLKGDIARYFPSIDHEILLNLLARKVGDKRLLDLLKEIIAHSPKEVAALRGNKSNFR